MNFKKHFFWIFTGLFLFTFYFSPPLSAQQGRVISILVDPKGTYLMTFDDQVVSTDEDGNIVVVATPKPATSFSLLSDISPGNIIRLRSEGDFNPGGGIGEAYGLLGLFSSGSGRLAPGSDSQEGIGVVSLRTYVGSYSTDIPEDFYIPFGENQCVTVEVPLDATKILFSPNDSFFSDNEDGNENEPADYKAKIFTHVVGGASIEYANPMQVIVAPQLNASEYYYSWPYDLVAGKPFAIRAGFHKVFRNVSDSTVFHPVLKIDNQVHNVQCVKGGSTTPGSCDFTFSGPGYREFSQEEQDSSGHFGTLNQVFLIPKDLAKKGSYDIEISLYSNDFPCHVGDSHGRRILFSQSFRVQVHEIKSPMIGLAAANCDHIKDSNDNSLCTTPNNINDFLNSEELSLFERLFPVPEGGDKKFKKAEYTAKVDSESLKQRIESSTNNVTIRNILLAFQTYNLVKHKMSDGFGYLLGIGATSFFTNQTDGLGLSSSDKGVAYPEAPAPFNRVGFVRADSQNEGTFLHELGHIFQQLKDFYRSPSDDQCTAHDLKIEENNRNSISCHRFNNYAQGRGYTGYDFKNRVFVDKPQSIMGASDTLNEQWIDRDTYIKVFNYLRNPSPDPELTLFSGIYAEGQFFNGKVNHYGAGVLHPLSTTGDLRIMLKDSSNQVLSESRVPSSFKMEILKEIGDHEHITSPVVPVVVAFPYQAMATQAVLMKVNEDGTETMIFSKALLPDNNPGYLLSDHHAYSTENNFPVLRKTAGANLTNKRFTDVSSVVFSKFMYSAGLRVAFDYNACSDSLSAGDGIALLFGKNPEDYSSTLPQGNQGADSNGEGVSLHLDIMTGEIQLKNGIGSIVARTSHQVSTGCDNWEKLKVRVNRNGKFLVIQGSDTLLEYKLTLSQLEQIAEQPIGWSAYSARLGQYRVATIHIDAIPFERTETEDQEE